MFAYPPSTRFGKAVPKTRIHAAASSNKRIRELFTAQIAEILWLHKLSPETLHLPARHGIAEIQVFSLHLKSPQLDPAILRTLDKAIPFPLLVEIHHGESIRFAATYKRLSEADASKWVIEGSFLTDWFHTSSLILHPLPVSLDLAALHDQLIARHVPLPPRPGESLRDLVARHHALQSKQREAAQLEAKLAREKHFNRKVELNQQLRTLSAELSDLGLRQPAAAFPEPACWPG
ncbi:MAG TPA: DUF4391 domain-containing protein, partial [Luteolibacter sp.]